MTAPIQAQAKKAEAVNTTAKVNVTASVNTSKASNTSSAPAATNKTAGGFVSIK